LFLVKRRFPAPSALFASVYRHLRIFSVFSGAMLAAFTVPALAIWQEKQCVSATRKSALDNKGTAEIICTQNKKE